MDSSRPAPTFSSSGPRQHSGQIPFSWEKLPGIPNKHPSSSSSTNKIRTAAAPSSKKSLLPPPPPSSASTTPKKHSKKASSMEQSEWDPFVAALVHCSRDHDGDQRCRDDEEDRKSGGGGGGGAWTVSKVLRRSIGDRLGLGISRLNSYGSCKVMMSSAVSDSIVYVPAGAHRRGGAYGPVSNCHRR